MHYDALILACVAEELAENLTGGRVQQVVLPDTHSVGMEIYAQRQRRYLLASAQPNQGRIHLASQKLRRGVEQETPLLLLLRKYVRESILDAVVQPDPTERILHLHFDHPGYGVTKLIVEPMGRLSNVVLVNANGNILDCVNRVRPGENARRVLMPGRPYVSPPPQDRLPPLDDGREGYYAELARLLQGGGKLWKALAEGVAGASPTLGREVAWRVLGDADAPAADAEVIAVAHALQELWLPVEDGAWSPGIWQEGDTCVGFSAYPVHFRPGYTPRDSISAALETYYMGQAEGRAGDAPSLDTYAGMRQQAAAQMARARRRVARQLAASAGDEPDAGAAAKLRTEAAWLLALHTQVTPGQTVLEVDLGEGGTATHHARPRALAGGAGAAQLQARREIGTRRRVHPHASRTIDRGSRLSRPVGDGFGPGGKSTTDRRGRQRIAWLWAAAPTPSPDGRARTQALISQMNFGPGFQADRVDLMGRVGPRKGGAWQRIARFALGEGSASQLDPTS